MIFIIFKYSNKIIYLSLFIELLFNISDCSVNTIIMSILPISLVSSTIFQSKLAKIYTNFIYKIIFQIIMSQLVAEIFSTKSNQKALSFRFTCALIILLACVWILCYFCESRLPELKEQELLSRLESQSVDKIDLYQVLSKVYNTNS